MQSAVSAAAADPIAGPEGRGNAGPVERVEKQQQLSHSSHRPLGISQMARDSHISTAPLRGHGKVENQKQVSHFSTAAHDDDSCLSENKNQRKEVGRLAASSSPCPLSLRSGGADFMLILQLENAPQLQKLVIPRGVSSKLDSCAAVRF